MFPRQVKVLGKNLKQPHDPHTTGITSPQKGNQPVFSLSRIFWQPKKIL